MRRLSSRMIVLLMAFLLTAGLAVPAVHAAEITDEAVLAVISQLESIDTLQEMQNKRSEYTARNHYDINTTDTSIISDHEDARSEYEAYVAKMFSARLAAQQAYDALNDSQKSQIDSELVEKLNDELSTVFNSITCSVTPRSDAYTFEAVNGGTGYGYEVSNHMVSGNIPQTFILVDTSDGKTSWTPSGMYNSGESNYDVVYCCDVETALKYATDYRRINLEDSSYYGKVAAGHIRAILQNAYPYVSVEEMKANLKSGGMNAELVDSLTRADMIAAVQMAVWTYANAGDGAQDGLEYFATIDITKNTGIYFTPLHDCNNECWDWLPGKGQRSFDARAAYRVNNLAYYLCNLPGVSADDDQIVISDINVTRAELIAGSDDTYSVGLYIHLNKGAGDKDNLIITVTSYSENADGTIGITNRTRQSVSGDTTYGMYVNAKYGDTIDVVVEGTQYLSRGVYFYEPEGGRDASQSLVGTAEGETNIRTEKSFSFNTDITKGLRIYKTDNSTGLPLSDITFTLYKAVPSAGESLGTIPTDEEISKYATDENMVGSVTTDVTGYASITLDDGTYLIVEEHNTDKVKAPVNPFFISIPMQQEVTAEGEEGAVTEIEYVDIVSIYPKNESVETPDNPPDLPPAPDNVTGHFSILKHDEGDESLLLDGAQFQVYRPATEDDTETSIITCDGVEYAVVPVAVDGTPLVLTTRENGMATSPELTCGTYFVVEIKAPAGYNLREEAISVTVTSDVIGEAQTIRISNQRGNLLPETGGIGTTWFWTIGGAMVIAAVILLVAQKRMSVYE